MTAPLVALVTSVVGALLLSVGAGWLERRLTPATLTVMCTVAALVSAVGMVVTFCVIGFAVLARDGEVAELGRWSPDVLRSMVPVPVVVGAAAGLAGLAMVAAGMRWLWLAGADVLLAERTRRQLPAGRGLPVVLPDSEPDAYTVGGIRARAVLTTGMLAALPERERRVVVAHELSHQRHRHDLYLRCVGFAAAMNPFLRPTRAVIEHAVERWADEDAAAAVLGDRRTVARAVARAGLARGGAARFGLGMVSSRVADRVRALLDPPRGGRRYAVVALTALIAVVATVAVLVGSQVEDGVEAAQRVLVSGQ